MTSTLRSADGRVVVPEQLRRRRVEVHRDRGRRRLRRLIAFGVTASLVIAGWALLRSSLMAVKHVTVTGSGHVGSAEVAKATGVATGVAMMDVSPKQVARELEALPWVASAKVSRQWPDEVTIEVVDRTPVAQVPAGRAFASVDDVGRVLETGVPRDVDLPLLTGRTAPQPGRRIRAAGPLLATATALPVAYRDRVERIGFARDGAVALTMRGDGVVTLGRSEALDAKFSSITAVLEHVGNLDKGCVLDVSVPTAPTLTPDYGCA